jgi:hypothetical protein
MCLLISQPKGITFSRREIEDFVSYNPDGFGLAYGDGRTLHLVRMVGTVSDIWDTYRTLAAGKRCVLHFRMTTHGATNADNAHPYPVTDDIVVAHNGVLSCGNPVDPCRSDTWHFIEYFLAPIARANPDILFTPAWGEMCGKLIGAGNKLAIAHRDGRIAIVNASAGVTHKGAWLSNTYAWSAPQKHHGYSWTPKHTGAKVGNVGKVSRIQDIPSPRTPATSYELTDLDVSDIWDTAQEHHATNPVDGLYRWTQQHPAEAAVLLAAIAPDCTEMDARGWLEEAAGDAVTYLMEYFDDDVSVMEDTPDSAYADEYAPGYASVYARTHHTF